MESALPRDGTRLKSFGASVRVPAGRSLHEGLPNYSYWSKQVNYRIFLIASQPQLAHFCKTPESVPANGNVGRAHF